MKVARAALVLPALLACARPSGAQGPAEPEPAGTFERHWYDGQAELNGYRWSGTRYGELRHGEAVAIFVSETFGAEERVKVERPDEHRGGTLSVLKLNLVRDFQTGIYDYDTMASVFVDAETLAPVKASFTSAEWCGHVFEQLDVLPAGVALEVRSYFEGESRRATLRREPAGILGDQLFLWLRGLRGHVLAPGETRALPYLADAFERRLRHAPAEWGTLRVARAAASARVALPAGSFEAVEYALEASDGRRGSVAVERDYPHRLLAWSWARGAELLDRGELAGSKRMRYWELSGAGQEALRAELGLE